MNIIKAAGVLVLALALAACGDLEESADAGSSDGPQTNSGNSENPPPDDVELNDCSATEFGTVAASGVIVNHSSKPSTYFIEVEFVDASGTRFDESIASSSTVAPGQQVEWEAPGIEGPRDGMQCRITSVERYAA